MDTLTRHFRNTSHLFGANSDWIEQLYEEYLTNPDAVDHEWRSYFDSLQETGLHDVAHSLIQKRLLQQQSEIEKSHSAEAQAEAIHTAKQIAVLRLINYYRTRGHQLADIDPIKLRPPPVLKELDPFANGLSEEDMNTVFDTGSLRTADHMKLRDLLDALKRIYTGTIGIEYMHMTETAQKRWIQERIERPGGLKPAPESLQIELLKQITSAEGLEHYLHRKYVGQKRFGLEGGEALVPLLVNLIQYAGSASIKELTIGMAHRGRLNVLVNVVGKAPAELFEEFEGISRSQSESRSGDVKYHLGYSAVTNTPGGPINTVLAFNPSHLEIVCPVVEGSVRARQRHRGNLSGIEVLPVLVHGDSAFAGQGVVMETFNMSKTRGFETGGTVHIVVNNQIGFTTSNPLDMRSTNYCTDVAKMVEAPIFHVNGDDPEAVLFVTKMALDYRTDFGKDVIIDLVCYRRQGHNEADEPAATQPYMYSKIRTHPTLRTIYAERLIQRGTVPADFPDKLLQDYFAALEKGDALAHNLGSDVDNPYRVNWKPYLGRSCAEPYESAVPTSRVVSLQERLSRLPDDFELHPRVRKIMENRNEMAAGNLPVDWGFAETMAYATLLEEGYGVRLSGQDSGRGTFFHRHAMLLNQRNGYMYVPLQNLSANQAPFIVINSLLSEEAVLAYEYGYATTEPETLTLWEAQFGDFANGAQVVIDQFISSAEAKWGRACGLTLLLPHGYEGQGPEHSSARVERYLQLCARENMQVCIPTEAAQIFHLLRRQMLRPCRKPLIVISPKSLLRHKDASSSLSELTSGTFRLVIGENVSNPDKIHGLILCSGRVYYALKNARDEQQLSNVAIIRIEQLYPFPLEALNQELDKYTNARQLVWCQEEPKNQGAWDQIKHRLVSVQKEMQSLSYAGRRVSASPATGNYNTHTQEEQALINDALEKALQ